MDISVQTTQYQVEDRSWLLSEHGTEPGATPSVVLDISLFTKATHFPNGFIKSGCVLGKVTATGLYGPYDDTAAGTGREVAAGILVSLVRVTRDNGTDATKVGGARLVHGFVDPAKLPYTGVAGGIDANGKADLKLIHFDTGA